MIVSLIFLSFVLGSGKETKGAGKKDCEWEFVCHIYWCMEESQLCACGNPGGDCYRAGCGGPAGEYYADIVQDTCTGHQVCNNEYHAISSPQCYYIASWSTCPNPSPNWSTKTFTSWDDCWDAPVQSCCVNNVGDSCSASNVCGQTNSGTIQCDGTCNASTPPNPSGYGNPCTSEANVCGQINSGTIQCDGTCSAAKPSDICNKSSCVSISAPNSITSGQQFNASVTMKNTGTKVWNSDATPHKLGSENLTDNERWGFKRVNLPSITNPENSVTFNFTATAPATAGAYPFSWKMVEDGIEWFGEICTKNIKVIPLPTTTLKANPESITLGEKSTLKWTVSNANSCWGWSGEDVKGDRDKGSWKTSTGGTEDVNPTATTKYNIECWNILNQSDGVKSATVTVVLPPETTLKANPENITSGESSTLTWTAKNAVGCWGWSDDNKAWEGEKSIIKLTDIVFPTKTTTYSIECWNALGYKDGVKSAKVTVIPLPTVTLKADPTSISTTQKPTDSTLTWTVANADGGGCWGWSNDGDKWEGGKSSGASNTDKVSPKKSTKYSIECWNALNKKSEPSSASICVSDCACKSETCYDKKCSECSGSFECNGNIPANTKGPWGNCSKNCGGGGTQKRELFCPSGSETQNCNSQPCPPGYREVAP